MRKCTILFLLLSWVSVDAQIVGVKETDIGVGGFVDANGKLMSRSDCYYPTWNAKEQYGTFRDGRDYIKSRVCAIDKWGNVIVPFLFQSVFFSDIEKYNDYYHTKDHFYFANVSDGSHLGIYSIEKKKLIIECNYDYIYFSDGIFNVGKGKGDNKKHGIISLDGREILKCEYDDYCVKLDDYYILEKGTEKLCADKNGKIIVRMKEKGSLMPIEDGIICTIKEINNKKVFVYYDSKGKELINGMQYDWVGYAGENIFIVLQDSKYGYFADGKEIVPCQFEKASGFVNGVANVVKDGTASLIRNPLSNKIIEIETGPTLTNRKGKMEVVSRYPAPDSDVDKDIPMAKASADNTFAFIIANENYPDAPVPYSLNDGRMFKEYCQKALGLPEKNINMYEDATFGNIITAVEKMKSIADAYEGEASVIFYYAGHGFPDEKQSTAYLLPLDGNASDINTTGYSLAKLYKELAALKLKSAVVLLDACFSGAKREDQMLAQSRGVAIKVKNDIPEGNILVYSAAQGDETAHQLEDKHHGLFTYYLLKELQATGGDVDMGTLTEYVTKQVKRQSVVINNKKQTPTVIPSQSLINSWQTMRLR